MLKSVKNYFKARRELRLRQWCIVECSSNLAAADIMCDYLMGDKSAPKRYAELHLTLDEAARARLWPDRS